MQMMTAKCNPRCDSDERTIPIRDSRMEHNDLSGLKIVLTKTCEM